MNSQVRRHLAMLAVAIGAAGLLACEDPELDRGIVVGKIDFDDPAWPLPRIPDTATVGVPVEIAVWTGGSGCYEYARTDGGVDGQSASVVPRDYFVVGGCSTDPEFVEHRTTRVFEEAGTAEITLWYNDGGAIRREDHTDDGRKVYTVEVSPRSDTLAISSRRSGPRVPQSRSTALGCGAGGPGATVLESRGRSERTESQEGSPVVGEAPTPGRAGGHTLPVPLLRKERFP